MYNILIAGSGKIGSLIACLLMDSGDYHVHLADLEFSGYDVKRLLKEFPKIKTLALDVKDEALTQKYIQENKIAAVVSSLPYFLNTHVARAAKAASAHYLDLTEDTESAAHIKNLAKDAKTAFVPQCGLAPGFISIAASTLMQEFDSCIQAKLRVGALPQRVSNALQYSLTWSTDGLINEYGNFCHAIEESELVFLPPLEGLEHIQIDGGEYEAFNTSGGLGSLAEVYLGKIKTLNYKTMRYPGHCEKMRFLMQELKLNEDRITLKKILEDALPKTYQDLVLVYVAVEGMKAGELIEESYLKKIYPQTIHNLEWSAIQVSTASSLCAVLDLILNSKKEFKGLVLQESFKLDEFLKSRFGIYYS